MTTDQLRRELARLADTAPVPHVASDTWPRARRSAVRDRVAATVATVAVVVGGAAAAFPLLGHESREAALPARISTSGDATLPVEGDLAVGRAAAAYLRFDGDAADLVVTTAVDGKHHLLSLPDLPRVSDRFALLGDQVLRLSPDGSELAYVYRQYDATPAGTGIAVVDLETGEVRRTQLAQPGQTTDPQTGKAGGVVVASLDWSPNGTHLVWSGRQELTAKLGKLVAGLIGPDGSSTPVPSDGNEFAVSDEGEVVLMPSGKPVRLWRDGEVVSTVDVGDPGHTTTAELMDGVLSMLRTSPVDGSFRTYLIRHGEGDVSGRVADAVGTTHIDLGWTSDGAVLVAPIGQDQSKQTVHRLDLADDGSVTDRVVMTVEVPTSAQLTLATALPVEGEHVDEDGAAWPWLVGGGLTALLLAGWLALRVRSDRRLRRGLTTG